MARQDDHRQPGKVRRRSPQRRASAYVGFGLVGSGVGGHSSVKDKLANAARAFYFGDGVVSRAKSANRIAYRCLSVFAALFLGWWGYHEGRAAYHMAHAYAAIPVNALYALQANTMAYDIFPQDGRFRRQLVLTLAAAARQRYPNIKIEPKALDNVFRISSSAGPDYPGVMIAMVELLVNFGRPMEAQPILDRLNAGHPKQVEKLRIEKWRD